MLRERAQLGFSDRWKPASRRPHASAPEADFKKFAAVLDGHLKSRQWLVGDAITTADISVASYLCYREACHYPVADFAHIGRWIGQIEALPSWQVANA